MEIKIKGNRYSIDWVYDEIKEINTDKIWGIKLHWRGDSWHIEVITKEECLDGYYHYEVGHWVNKAEVKRLLNIKELTLLGVHTNTPRTFKDAIKEIGLYLNQEMGGK